MVVRFKEARDRFLELFAWVEGSIGAEHVERFLRATQERNQQVMNDSITENMLMDRLGCGDCMYSWDEKDVTKDTVNIWCRKFREMPNLLVASCQKFKGRSKKRDERSAQ